MSRPGVVAPSLPFVPTFRPSVPAPMRCGAGSIPSTRGRASVCRRRGTVLVLDPPDARAYPEGPGLDGRARGMSSTRVGSPADSTPSYPGGTGPILDRRSGSTYSKPGRSEPMPTVTIHGEKAVEVEAGKKLVLAIEDAGIDILHRCGGNARCTTCRVEVLDGSVPPMGEVEKERLAREGDLRRISGSPARSTSSRMWRSGSSTARSRPGFPPDRARPTERGSRRPAAAPPAVRTARLFVLLTLGAALATRGSAAHLGATPRASVELRLTRLLLAGTERHGTPRSDSLDSFGRCPSGDPPPGMIMHPARTAGSRSPSLLDQPAAIPEGLATDPRAIAVPELRTGSIHRLAQIDQRHPVDAERQRRPPCRRRRRRAPSPRANRASGTSRTQAIGQAKIKGQREGNGR